MMNKMMNKIIIFMAMLICITGFASADVHISSPTVSNYNMNTAGETYYLDNNVSAVGTAFQITANNIVFDGQGNTIFFSAKTSGSGIFAQNRDNITIKNVNIVCSNSSLSNTNGIYLYTTNNSRVNSIAVHTGTGHAIFFRNAHNNNVVNSELISDSGTVVYFDGSANNKISDSTITGSSYAILYNNANTNIINKCSVYSSNNIGVSIPANSAYNTIQYSTVLTGNNVGVRLLDSTYNNIAGNTIVSDASVGVYLAHSGNGCRYNTVSNNDISSNTQQALYLYNAHNNIIRSNNIISSSNTEYACYIRDSANNTIEQNIINNNGNNIGTFIGYSSNNNIVRNNRFTAKNNKGIFIFNNTQNTFTGNVINGKYTYAPVKNNHILVVGDSISAGTTAGVTYGAYSNTLRGMLPDYTISNAAFSGERAYQGRERFQQNLDLFMPEVVIIEYGTNDFLSNRTKEEIAVDLFWMYDTAEARGIRAYLINTFPIYKDNSLRIELNEYLDVNAGSRRIINGYDIIDSSPLNGEYDSYVSNNFVDGVHPTDASHIEIGTCITNYILDDYINSDRERDKDRTTEVFVGQWLGILFLVILLIIYSMVGQAEVSTDPSVLMKLLVLMVLIAVTVQVIGNVFFGGG